MRRAAYKAGLISEEASSRLELALEPEAACVACKENEELQKGDRFMVLDCGGGTVDITMHVVVENAPNLTLDELRRPAGGPWGSTFVDDEFERFISNLIGVDAFRQFKPSSPWIEFMKCWEDVKLSYDPSQDLSGESFKVINMGHVLEVSTHSPLTLLYWPFQACRG